VIEKSSAAKPVCASDSGAERKKEKTKAERPNDLIESRL
jgi:hypothetical protein